MIRFELAGPPRGKERVKRAQFGHAYTPDRTVRFEDRMALAAQSAMNGRPPLEGPLHLKMTMYFPVPVSWSQKRRAAALMNIERPTVKPDIDNSAKLVDSCNLILWVDDKQIVQAELYKFYSDRPRTEVEVRLIVEAGGLFS